MTTSQPRHAKTRALVPVAVHLSVIVAVGVLVPLLLRGREANKDLAFAPENRSAVDDEAEQRVAQIIANEELILRYTPQLGQMAKSAMNLQLPDFRSEHLFAEKIRSVGRLQGNPSEAEDMIETICVEMAHWPLDNEEILISRDSLDLWRPLLAELTYFEHAKFYIASGEVTLDDNPLWETHGGFSAVARTNPGRRRSISAKLTWLWRPSAETGTSAGGHTASLTEGSAARGSSRTSGTTQRDWQIVGWRTDKVTIQETAAPLFTEVLDAAVPETSVRQRARESIADELVVRAVRDENFEPPTKYFDQYSFDRHPGIAVVDIDRDGWDDVYAMDRWGRNLMLRNRGDGTFEDIAAKVGLDLRDHCSCALFADFDNDGDSDLFLGRTLERSRYFVNEDGRFVDRGESLVATRLPYLVSAITAADFNGDGLLDVYFSTYAADTIDKDIAAAGGLERLLEGGRDAGLLGDFLTPANAKELLRRYEESRTFTSRVGPPNLLLVNHGGEFKPETANEDLKVWRNTYQATWGDYDNDGDPDLYVANDFSPNHLFRNDDGQFVDVTEPTRTADIGFGMGAAWGDYDNDGRQDLYVSNMFSKAGRRIAGSMRGAVDPTFERMAGGNSLFHNGGDAFEKVSGLEPPSLMVEKVGWSWGGQFIDADNDGYLDVYATSGYYSAPPQIAVQVDL